MDYRSTPQILNKKSFFLLNLRRMSAWSGHVLQASSLLHVVIPHGNSLHLTTVYGCGLRTHGDWENVAKYIWFMFQVTQIASSIIRIVSPVCSVCCCETANTKAHPSTEITITVE